MPEEIFRSKIIDLFNSEKLPFAEKVFILRDVMHSVDQKYQEELVAAVQRQQQSEKEKEGNKT